MGADHTHPHLVPCSPQHILYCIVDSECKSRDVLQSYFDLLGELMKFNVDAFKRFNKYINTDAKVRLAWGLHVLCCGVSCLWALACPSSGVVTRLGSGRAVFSKYSLHLLCQASSQTIRMRTLAVTDHSRHSVSCVQSWGRWSVMRWLQLPLLALASSLPVSTMSAPVPGVPETDQQLTGGLQHAGALCHSVTGPI